MLGNLLKRCTDAYTYRAQCLTHFLGEREDGRQNREREGKNKSEKFFVRLTHHFHPVTRSRIINRVRIKRKISTIFQSSLYSDDLFYSFPFTLLRSTHKTHKIPSSIVNSNAHRYNRGKTKTESPQCLLSLIHSNYKTQKHFKTTD